MQALVGIGLRVWALAPDHDDRSRQLIRELGAEPVDISLDRAGLRPLRDVMDLIRLAAVLRRLRPDATFSYFIKPVIYGSFAAKIARIPHIFALVPGLGYVFTSGPGSNSVSRRFLRWIVSRMYGAAFLTCERVFFQNQDDVAYFVDRKLIALAKALRLNGTGVDLERLRPAPATERPLRFLLMARLLREKGIVEFVEAARLVCARHPDSEFMLLGGLDPNPGGLSHDEVTAWVESGLIHWMGHVEDVRPWIAKSSVYVLPSYYREGVPRSTQEAMAMGRPVITTDNVGCRETVEDGVNGYLVPVRNPGALAEAMLRFVRDPKSIGRMGLESRRMAEERFDVREINALLLGGMGLTPKGCARAGRTGDGL